MAWTWADSWAVQTSTRWYTPATAYWGCASTPGAYRYIYGCLSACTFVCGARLGGLFQALNLANPYWYWLLCVLVWILPGCFEWYKRYTILHPFVPLIMPLLCTDLYHLVPLTGLCLLAFIGVVQTSTNQYKHPVMRWYSGTTP